MRISCSKKELGEVLLLDTLFEQRGNNSHSQVDKRDRKNRDGNSNDMDDDRKDGERHPEAKAAAVTPVTVGDFSICRPEQGGLQSRIQSVDATIRRPDACE